MLTIIYDKFRFAPEASVGFDYLRKAVLPPNIVNEYRVHNNTTPFKDTTSHVALLGPKSLYHWTHKTSLMAERGYPQVVVSSGRVLPAIATFHPQDVYDWRFQEDEETVSNQTEKDFGITHPENWRFWMGKDILKLLSGPKPSIKLNYVPFPNLNVAINFLRSLTGGNLFIDIENRRSDLSLDCIGFCNDTSPVFVCPIYLPDNTRAYSKVDLLLAALAKAFQRNRVIVHNASHDLAVLASRYHVPWGADVYDTMAAMHRFYPEVEKSLAHAMSLWTWQPFHKDQGGAAHNRQQLERFWKYNALDVLGMKLVYQAQQEELEKNDCLKWSVNQVMSSIPDYLLMGLQGIKVDEHRLATARWNMMRRIKQFKRVLKILSGFDFNPCSNKQCVDYFHGKLNYPVIKRSRETSKPSLDSQALYKLAVKHPNPLLQIVIKFRELCRAEAMMTFEDFKI